MLSKFLRDIITTVVDSIVMPTGKNLVPTLKFACAITVCNILFRILGLKVFLNIGGCIVAIVVLVVLLIIERSEYSAISKMYRDAELYIKDIKTRQQAACADWKNGGAYELYKKYRSSLQRGADSGRSDNDSD